MTTPTSINIKGDQPRETGNEHFVNIFYVQILNLFEDFLSLYTLPYSKASLDFYSSQGSLLWVLASLFPVKVRTRGKREK